ncbi:hypothetical protein C8Q80DRAFT_387131 [Daedaleopsis nitida]|nr:hypothetical protein C8Q80DRAFT_387131 [Daedaleopsis nitida]
MPPSLRASSKRVYSLLHASMQIDNTVSSLTLGDDQHSAAPLSQCISSYASQDVTHLHEPRQIAPLPRRAQFNMNVDVQFLLHAPAIIDAAAAVEDQPRKRFKHAHGHGEQVCCPLSAARGICSTTVTGRRAHRQACATRSEQEANASPVVDDPDSQGLPEAHEGPRRQLRGSLSF